MSPNDADGMANSVDPDQTAPRSSLIWVCTVCPGISVQKLRVLTVISELHEKINNSLWKMTSCFQENIKIKILKKLTCIYNNIILN